MKLDTTKAPSFPLSLEFKHFFMPITRFALTETDSDEYRCDLVCQVPDRDNGTLKPLHWARFISRDLTPTEVASDIYREVRNMLVHELAEAWHLDGKRIHDPHG